MTQRQYVIPTLPGMGRGLVNHDERSKAYRAVALTDETKPRTRAWRRGGAYDQGQTSQCVAYTGKGILNTARLSAGTPYRVRAAYDPAVLYAGAQQADEWPGVAYDGTSGLGLCRYLTSAGLIESYHWAFGLEEALLTLSHVGPLGIGIRWRRSMYYPDPSGRLTVDGDIVGGHEVEVVENDVRTCEVEIANSWGPSWGVNGRARLSWDNFGTLLADQGDAFVITA